MAKWLQGLRLLSTDLQNVSIDLINEFGSVGYLVETTTKPDPITGLGGGESKREVQYFREYYESRELVEGVILNGDAKLMIVTPKFDTAHSFIDDSGTLWGIVSITPIEEDGLDIVYQVHIRK